MDILVDNGNDPIVISTIVGSYLMERILIDNNSVVEALMYEAFKKNRAQ